MKVEFESVIFDLDGTLLDFEILSHEALDQVLTMKFGNKYVFDWPLHTKIVGRRAKGPDSWSTVILESLGIPREVYSADQYADEVEQYLENRISNLDLMTGAESLFGFLIGRNIKIGIATSSNRKHVDKKLQNYSFLRNNITIVCGDDKEVKRGKPHPDIFLECARQMGLDITNRSILSKIIVFEDSPGGILGARSAGMFSVAVPDKRLFPTEALVQESFNHANLICRNGLVEFTQEILESLHIESN